MTAPRVETRHYRKHRPEQADELKQNNRQRELELEAAEEEALAQRVEVVVQARVAAAVGGEEVLARVAARLKEERAKLEERVTRQLDMERKMLLERKRREDAERRQAQEQMERIIEENKRKVEEAQRRAAEAVAEQQGLPKPAAVPVRRKQGLIIVDD
ncbi:hypothetical protein CHLNCDRAFT_133224 [Chlorella variabilis]|uniref:Uncharacterized protein n=1 Tax=Chlorella variabilis TaxID=554065 RepID=E1Z2M8_CHLVA|nr:hypothetical protein CHLNCDRAFT_133224 [Chlorella variabilis]EFN60028.1 hypothetical protein CHLNCDRAFT_133224 [Chlorella variabilis]|eukprot:XP_005852130.1 hypothetical protein CHLNCDRAFT_133224 [Chlorella variabilis]